MLYQKGEVQRQTSNVIPTPRLVRLPMTAQIRDDDVVLHREPGDVSLEDLSGAREAMQLAQSQLVVWKVGWTLRFTKISGGLVLLPWVS
jgi:hypothetical protein